MKKITIILCLFFISCSSMSSNKNNDNPIKFLWIQNNTTLVVIKNKSLVNNLLPELELFYSNGQKISYEVSKNKFLIDDQSGMQLTLKEKIDPSQNIYIKSKDSNIYGYLSLDYMNKSFNTQNIKLGVSKLINMFHFKVWSPMATKIELLIYSAKDNTLILSKEMKRTSKGIWIQEINNQEHKVEFMHYLYRVTALGKTNLALDPYAKSMSAFNPKSKTMARGVVLDLDFDSNDKYTSIKNGSNEVDFIGMEAHIRDFSHQKDSLRGSYKGFEKSLSYFEKLGITHIQLMPLHNFHTVNELDRSYQGKNITKNNINYNWGYDPQNYFTPEGWYSLNPEEPLARINEVRSLTKAIHSKKMGVILDVVYNHVFDHNIFENIAPGSYLRRKPNGDISFHTGAGASVESRNLMVRKMIIDSLLLWKNFYHFDGFRFDLMGFHDKETMLQIRSALGSDTILYGEAWEFTDLPMAIATTKSNLPAKANLSAFNDTGRDSFTGVMESKGFIQGNYSEIPKVKAAIIAGLKDYPDHNSGVSLDRYHRFAETPSMSLNYLTIHDGFTLWDKINLSLNADFIERQKRVKQALAMLLTSQGKIILHGGVDLGRSKPLAKNDPEKKRAHTTREVNIENGVKYFHENTYKSPDITNEINWSKKNEFKNVSSYLKGLISLRRALPGLRYKKASSLKKGLRFLKSYSDDEISTLIKKYKDTEYEGYKTFLDKGLELLEIEFIGAPDDSKNKSYFVAGEVHPEGQGKNPRNNKFIVKFNEFGRGVLKLSKQDLKSLDLRSWSDPEALQVKLVETAGLWKTIHSAYTTTGNNSIHPSKILKGNKVIIDLRLMNHRAGDYNHYKDDFVAYIIDNTLEENKKPRAAKLNLKKVIVVHNAKSSELILDIPEIKNEKRWKVFVDDQKSGVRAIHHSKVKIKKGQLFIPRNSSTVIGI